MAKPAASKPSADRDRLRNAITARRDEEGRLAALEEAQDRAHQQLWYAQTRVQEAEEALRRATREAPTRKVYAFLNSDPQSDSDPVADAAAGINTARSEVTRLEDLEASISVEIDRVQSALRSRRVEQHMAIAEIASASPAYARLLELHTAAWQQLRTIKAALAAVATGCHGQLGQRWIDEVIRSEPLEADRIGYPIDKDFVSGWTSAMSQLEEDADAPLPSG